MRHHNLTPSQESGAGNYITSIDIHPKTQVVYAGGSGDFGYLAPLATGQRPSANSENRLLSSSLKVEGEAAGGRAALHYISLAGHIQDSALRFGIVGKTHATREGIFFNASTLLFHYFPGKDSIAIIDPVEVAKTLSLGKPPDEKHNRFYNSFYENKTLYIQHNGLGLLQWSGGKFALLPHTGLLTEKGKGLYAIFVSPSIKGQGRDALQGDAQQGDAFQCVSTSILLYVQPDGFYQLDSVIRPLLPADQNHITYPSSALPSCGTMSGGQWLIAGTQNEGLFGFLQSAGKGGTSLFPFFRLGRREGLADNMVWGIAPSHSSLWTCTGNGISKISFPSPFALYSVEQGIEGSVQSIYSWGNMLCLATTQGVYTSDAEKYPPFEKVKEINRECLSIQPFFTSAVPGFSSKVSLLLVAAGSDGLWALEKDGNGRVAPHKVGNFHSYGLDGSDGRRVFAGGRNGVWVLKQTGDDLTFRSFKLLSEKEINEVTTIVTRQHTPSLTEVWLGTYNEGLWRLLVNERDSVLEKEQIAPGRGIPEGNTNVFPWRDEEGKKWIMVATQKGLYEIPPLDHRRNAEGDSSGKPVLSSRFGKFFADSGRGVYKFYQQSNGDVWVTSVFVAHCKKQTDGTYTIDTLPFKGVDIGTVRTLCEGEDSAVWLGGDDGIGRYAPGMRGNYEEPYYCLVTGVWAKPQEKEDSLLFGGFYAPGEKTEGEGPLLPYAMNHLLFRYAAPFYEKEELTEYSYRLEGREENWSEWSKDKKKEYTNLPEGKYNFRIKARNIYGKESEEGGYAFVIKPPFHRTLLFYLYQGGGILFLFALAVVFSSFLRYGWAGVAGAMTGTVAVFVIFEYTQNFVEAEFSDVLGDVILYKVLLNVGCGLLLFPIEIVINNMLGIKVVRIWKGDKAKGMYDKGMEEGYAKGFDDGKRSVERFV